MRQDLQRLMDQGDITFTYSKNPNNNVNMIVLQFNLSESIEVTYNSQNSVVAPLVICLPGPVSYVSNKGVP